MSDDCSVCEDEDLLQDATCNEKAFRWHVLKTLCYISEFLSQDVPGSDVPPPVVLPLTTIAFGDISTGYTDTEFLDSKKTLRFFRAVNNTDADVILSDDNTIDKWFIPANSVREFDFGSMDQTLLFSTALYIKRSNTASVGNFYLEGSY